MQAPGNRKTALLFPHENLYSQPPDGGCEYRFCIFYPVGFLRKDVILFLD